MAKKAVQATRPYWAARKNAGVASITFNRRFGSSLVHDLRDLQQMEDQLMKLFRSICLAGDFTVGFNAQEMGGSHLKGLTVCGVNGNRLLVGYQPAGNDSRYSYGVSLPSADMAIEVHSHLNEAIKKASANEQGLRAPLTLVPKAQSLVTAQQVAETSVEATPLSVTPRVAEIQSGDQLMMVEFDASLDGETPFEALKQQLLEILVRYGSEGLFTVKKGTPTKVNTSSASGVQWCRLQPNANGIGFWFRDVTGAPWHKYALVPDNTFDLTAFAAEVTLLPPVAMHPEVKGILHKKALASPQDFIDNAHVYTDFLNHLAMYMQQKSLHEVPSSVMTKMFETVVGEAYSPNAIGRLFAQWSEKSLLRRFKINQSSGNYAYGLGLAAAEFLPESLKGLAPKRVVVTPESGAAVAAALAAKTANAPSRVQPTVVAAAQKASQPPAAKAAVAKVLVLDSNAMDDAFAMLTKQEQAITEAKAKLGQFIEVSAAVKVCQGEIEAIDAEIDALVAKRQAVAQKRDELAAELPSAEMVTAMMSSLHS